MLHRLWLVFAQTATVCLALLFVVSTLKPEWLPTRSAAPQAETVVAARSEPAAKGTGPARCGSHSGLRVETTNRAATQMVAVCAKTSQRRCSIEGR